MLGLCSIWKGTRGHCGARYGGKRGCVLCCPRGNCWAGVLLLLTVNGPGLGGLTLVPCRGSGGSSGIV